MRVKVLSVHRGREGNPTLVARVQVVRVYRGQSPRPNQEIRFILPPCGPAAVSVRSGSDLVIYNPTQPGRVRVPAYNWVEYERAKRFDPSIR